MADITKKPNEAVSNVTVKRDGAKVSVTWSEKSALTSKDNVARHQYEVVRHYLVTGKKGKKGDEQHKETDTVKVGKKSASYTIPVADFYPAKPSGNVVTEVRAKVYGKNSKGTGSKHADERRAITAPPKPKLAAPTIVTDGDSAGRVQCAVSVSGVSGNQHRTDIIYWVERQSSIASSKSSADNTANALQKVKPTSIMKGTDNGVTVSVDESLWQGLQTPGEWVSFAFKAYSRGLAGDSATASAKYDICWPAKPVLKDVVFPDDRSRITAIVSSNVKSAGGAKYRTEQMQLQIAFTEASSPSAGDWSDLDGSQGSDTATALTCSTDITPNVGEHVFIRVKATNDIPVYVQYSNAVELVDYYRAPTDGTEVSESELGIVSTESCDSGTAIKVVVGWNDDSNNACEVAYSTDQDAWRSDSQPTTVAMETDATWEDSVSQSETYAHTAWLKITKSIEEGQTYHVKARRYSTAGDEGSTGWTQAAQVRTTSVPDGLTLTAPSIIALGSSATLSWLFGGADSQSAFVVKDADGNGIGDGGSETSFTVPASVLAEPGEHRFHVEVQTTDGGDWVASDEAVIVVRKAPGCSVSCGSTIGALPFSFGATCDAQGAKVTVQLIADGVSSRLPDGDDMQRFGDVVWSETVSDWDASTESMEVPAGTHLIDGASYYLRMVGTVDGLRGEVASHMDGGVESPVTVAWSHQAVAPGAETTVAVDADAKSAVLTPAKPDTYRLTADNEIDPEKAYYELHDGSYSLVNEPSEYGLARYYERRYAEGDGPSDSDVCDVYRMTMDGCHIIADGVPFGTEVTDPYAPFSDSCDLAYRLATRTADGDVDWEDFSYELGGSCMRLDWGASSVECEYDIEVDDEWEKPYEGRAYLDGTRTGSWGAGADRVGSLSFALRSGFDDGSEALLRDLARYDGPVFVRTPDGLAYQANVDVSKLSHSYSTGKVSCSLKADEMAMDSFMAIVASGGGE